MNIVSDFIYPRNSVSAIIACYKDSEAIPIMADRLIMVFE